jgi:His-Xaa-Ser system protein HxsD
MQIIKGDKNLILKIDKEIYSSDVLHKCFYWYGNSFSVDIESKEKFFEVILTKSEADKEDWDQTVIKIKRDLIDFKLRDIVTKETINVRDLIIAKAFANFETDNENSPIDVSDPVGFNPGEIKNDKIN